MTPTGRGRAESSLHLLTGADLPPVEMLMDGEVVGISADLIKAVMARSGMRFTISVYPWTRAFDMAQKQRDSCFFSATRTPAREKLFKWVGPLWTDRLVAFARADNPVEIAAVEELKSHRIGAAQGEALSVMLRDAGIIAEEISGPNADELNLRKLISGRIDFWVTPLVHGSYFARQQGITNLRSVVTLGSGSAYLACNSSLPENVIEHLNDALLELTQNGKAAAIYQTYLGVPPP